MSTERITELEKQLEHLNAAIENFDAADYFDETDFMEELNNTLPDVGIAGYTYAAGWALSEIDPTAFRTEFNTWVGNKDNTEVAEYNELIAERDEVEEELAEARHAMESEDEEEDA